MSSLKKIRKSIINRRNKILRFDPTLYNNAYGSVILTYCITEGIGDNSPMISFIRSTWNKILKNPDAFFDFVPGEVPDTEFIERTLAVFGVAPSELFKELIVKVTGQYNILFAPKLPGGEILPLREDGFMGITLKTGTITRPYGYS